MTSVVFPDSSINTRSPERSLLMTAVAAKADAVSVIDSSSRASTCGCGREQYSLRDMNDNSNINTSMLTMHQCDAYEFKSRAL